MNHLVRKVQRTHDPEAFVKLMEMHKQSMVKTAKSYLSNEEDVADVVQEAILTCYEKLDSLKEPKYFKTWLIRIVINKCKDVLRKNRELSIMDELPEQGDMDRSMSDLEFMDLLESLDEKYRIILVLYYADGFNTREIGEILDMNERTVKTRLVRGRDQFAKKYQEVLAM